MCRPSLLSDIYQITPWFSRSEKETKQKELCRDQPKEPGSRKHQLFGPQAGTSLIFNIIDWLLSQEAAGTPGLDTSIRAIDGGWSAMRPNSSSWYFAYTILNLFLLCGATE
jgi:hypothetical protein